jgi:nitroreductase
MADRTLPTSVSDIAVPERYAGVYRDRRRECGFRLYDSIGIAHDDRAGSAREMLKNFAFFGAPHAAIITTPRDLGTYGAVDCGGFITTFMIVARSHGIATIAQGAIAIYSSFVRDYFDIPEDRLVLCGLSFGFENLSDPVNQFRTSRAPIKDVVKWISA